MNPSGTRLNRATMQKVQLQVIPWLSPHNRIWLNPFLIFFFVRLRVWLHLENQFFHPFFSASLPEVCENCGFVQGSTFAEAVFVFFKLK